MSTVVRADTRPPDTTYGVSSDLTGEAHAAATALWDHLERRHGLSEARAAAHPHLSYLVGDVAGGTAQVEALAVRLAAAARRVAPFEVEVDGLDVFDGPAPVLFLRVVPNEALRHAHAVVLEATRDAFSSVWPYYLAEAWKPHITLALRDLAPEHLALVRVDLENRARRLQTRLETLDLVHVTFPRHVYLRRVAFGAGGASQ